MDLQVAIPDSTNSAVRGRAFSSCSSRATFISSESEFTPKTILTQEERIKLVYRAKVSLENTQGRLKPGMQADAEIALK